MRSQRCRLAVRTAFQARPGTLSAEPSLPGRPPYVYLYVSLLSSHLFESKFSAHHESYQFLCFVITHYNVTCNRTSSLKKRFQQYSTRSIVLCHFVPSKIISELSLERFDVPLKNMLSFLLVLASKTATLNSHVSKPVTVSLPRLMSFLELASKICVYACCGIPHVSPVASSAAIVGTVMGLFEHVQFLGMRQFFLYNRVARPSCGQTTCVSHGFAPHMVCACTVYLVQPHRHLTTWHFCCSYLEMLQVFLRDSERNPRQCVTQASVASSPTSRDRSTDRARQEPPWRSHLRGVIASCLPLSCCQGPRVALAILRDRWRQTNEGTLLSLLIQSSPDELSTTCV